MLAKSNSTSQTRGSTDKVACFLVLPSCHSCRTLHKLARTLASPAQQVRGLVDRPHQHVVRATGLPELVFREGYTEVEELKGCRLVIENEKPTLQYLVKWKDGSEDTWENAINLSEDLIRVYEENWWNAARKADVDTMIKMMAGGREILANAVNEDRRSALHFAAAVGSLDCAKLLVEAGADLNLQDTLGYTPLHMAAGYMHTPIITLLLEAGADPEIKDNKGKDVVGLVEDLRARVPVNMANMQRRAALEEVANCLIDRLYEDVYVDSILDTRPGLDGKREFLVQYSDGRPDEWLPESLVAADVLEDWEAGLETAQAEAIIDVVQVGLERRFKLRWSDGYPTSWEPEENVSPELIALFQQQNPELFEQRTSIEAAASSSFPTDYETQWSTGYKVISSSSSSSSMQESHAHNDSANEQTGSNGNGHSHGYASVNGHSDVSIGSGQGREATETESSREKVPVGA